MSRVDTVPWFGTKSHSRRMCNLAVLGSQELLSLPVEVTTKCIEVKWLLSQRLGIDVEKISFIVKQTPGYRQLLDTEEIRSHVTVKGVKSWTREKATYPHPICVIGAGHQGLRQALSFLKEGITDFTVFDRLDRVGGVAWVQNANTTSKLQTELGVYHLQYDKDYPCPRETMKTWPTSSELLDHFQEVSQAYGILAHIQLKTSVVEIKTVVTNKDLPFYAPEKQYFDIVTQRWAQCLAEGDESQAKFSAIAAYPGSLIAPWRIEYKGEEVFEGTVGYGMFNEFDYSLVRDQVPAVLGMGAFGVENVRTCLEHGAAKVWLLCRRKNLAMPRMMSWLINQSLYPVTGAMILHACKPMYDLLPDDPWTYYGVVSNKDRTNATIRQKSRFGIGDVWFLATYYKRCEQVVDTIKRLRPRQIMLDGGGSLDADHLIKVLGFQADSTVDKVLAIKEMVGFFANGDWRRWVVSEFPGVDAGRFGGTSASPGFITTCEMESWFLNYPKDLDPLFGANILPKRKADKDKGLPAYVWENRQGNSVIMFISGGIVPALAELQGPYMALNRQRMREAHPLEAFLGECAAEWEAYEKQFREPGETLAKCPYPYTVAYLQELVEDNDREGEEDAVRQAQRASGLMA